MKQKVVLRDNRNHGTQINVAFEYISGADNK
jgi:hypothetical protein